MLRSKAELVNSYEICCRAPRFPVTAYKSTARKYEIAKCSTNTTTAKSQAVTGEGQQWLDVLKVPRLLIKKIVGQ